MSQHQATTQRALRNVLGTFPTGVTVITATCLPEGRPVGLTVNSFSSVSLDPPLALWSISRRSPNLAQFEVGKTHVIHILARQQAGIALQFANPAADKFAGVDWRLDEASGAPAIEGCVARLFCRTESVTEGGDHLVIISRVLRHEATERAPLVFYRGAFVGLGERATTEA
jgi:3-hydroxy-9,10-secoandrosta-1,3,5(10)-triene-9,17-dione monooxygenase reductase component